MALAPMVRLAAGPPTPAELDVELLSADLNMIIVIQVD